MMSSVSGIPRRRLLLLAAISALGACSRQPTLAEKIAKDPYLPRLRSDPMYSWHVDGAERQAPHETPYDQNSIAELKIAEIIIVHSVQSGVDINDVYAQARVARTAAGYNESDFRVTSDGLNITCYLGIDADNRIVSVTLSAP
jgi:hypothetical protein